MVYSPDGDELFELRISLQEEYTKRSTGQLQLPPAPEKQNKNRFCL